MFMLNLVAVISNGSPTLLYINLPELLQLLNIWKLVDIWAFICVYACALYWGCDLAYYIPMRSMYL